MSDQGCLACKSESDQEWKDHGCPSCTCQKIQYSQKTREASVAYQDSTDLYPNSRLTNAATKYHDLEDWLMSLLDTTVTVRNTKEMSWIEHKETGYYWILN